MMYLWVYGSPSIMSTLEEATLGQSALSLGGLKHDLHPDSTYLTVKNNLEQIFLWIQAPLLTIIRTGQHLFMPPILMTSPALLLADEKNASPTTYSNCFRILYLTDAAQVPVTVTGMYPTHTLDTVSCLVALLSKGIKKLKQNRNN